MEKKQKEQLELTHTLVTRGRPFILGLLGFSTVVALPGHAPST